MEPSRLVPAADLRQVDAGTYTKTQPQIFVDPDYFGKGVGSKLLAAAESSIASSGSCDDGEATVHALEKNERACRFYIKHGWTAERVLNSKIETTILRPGALHKVLFMHPWRQVRFRKRVVVKKAPEAVPGESATAVRSVNTKINAHSVEQQQQQR